MTNSSLLGTKTTAKFDSSQTRGMTDSVVARLLSGQASRNDHLQAEDLMIMLPGAPSSRIKLELLRMAIDRALDREAVVANHQPSRALIAGTTTKPMRSPKTSSTLRLVSPDSTKAARDHSITIVAAGAVSVPFGSKTASSSDEPSWDGTDSDVYALEEMATAEKKMNLYDRAKKRAKKTRSLVKELISPPSADIHEKETTPQLPTPAPPSVIEREYEIDDGLLEGQEEEEEEDSMCSMMFQLPATSSSSHRQLLQQALFESLDWRIMQDNQILL
jgi:hypothetical protein